MRDVYSSLRGGYSTLRGCYLTLPSGSSALRRVQFWSALTCQRFGSLRPVAAGDEVAFNRRLRRQVADYQSGDRSPHSKKSGRHMCRGRCYSKYCGGDKIMHGETPA